MKRVKKKINPMFFKVLSVLLMAALISSVFLSYKKQQELNALHNEDRSALQAQITAMQRSGYVATGDIAMGTLLTEDLLTYRTDIPSDMSQEFFITVEDLGKILTVDVAAGMPIYTTEVSAELAADYTERECGFIYLNSNAKDSDYVDIRIMFPNGEDYVVASKKCLKSPSVLYNNCYLWLTEAENDLLSAAIVDANINGAKLYVNRYVNPAVQDANIPTYTPCAAVISAMKINPNIVTESELELSETVRQDTEQRLKEFRELYPEYVIDDQLVDEISRKDFISGVVGGTGTAAPTDGTGTAAPTDETGAAAPADGTGTAAPIDGTQAEEGSYVE